MLIDKIIAAIPGKSRAEREQMRRNAEEGFRRNKGSGTSRDRGTGRSGGADRVLLAGMPLAERDAQAFRTRPPSEAEEKALRALLDHPGATSDPLSEVCGWGGLSWHLHFAEVGKRREHLLWAAPHNVVRDTDFWCGMLADFDRDGSRWTMKPEVVAGLGGIGLTASALD